MSKLCQFLLWHVQHVHFTCYNEISISIVFDSQSDITYDGPTIVAQYMPADHSTNVQFVLFLCFHYRYYVIVHPMKAKYTCTVGKTRRAIVVLWLLSFFLAFPILIGRVSNRISMNRNWINQKPNPALKTQIGNK